MTKLKLVQQNTRTQTIFKKMVFGAAIAYASLWILAYLPISGFLAIPISGAIAILIVEYIAGKTGFFLI